MDTDTGIKVLFMIFIFLVALIFGLMPYAVKSCRSNMSLIGLANAFSGGIFLAIALLHIIPEAHTHYLIYLHKEASGADYDSHSHGTTRGVTTREVNLNGNHRNLHGVDNVHEFLELGFPLPYFMVFLGYTLILILDKVMFDSHSLVHDHDHNPVRESFRKSLIGRRRSNSHAELDLDLRNGKAAYEDNKNYNEFKDEDDAGDNEEDGINEGIRRFLSKADRFSARMSSALSQKHKKGVGRARANMGLNKANTGEPNSNGPFGATPSFITDDSSVAETPVKSIRCDLTPYILMIALSVHSVFEGIAMGLQADVADIWSFLIAIGTHKWAAAMSLGISLSQSLENRPNTLKSLIMIFALATPIGIVFGMVVMDAPPLINIIFSGLSGGTFIYIAASEVVVEEFSIPKNKWVKL